MFCCSVWAKAGTFTMHCNGQKVSVKEQNDVAPEYGLSAYKYAELAYDGQELNIEVETDFSFSDVDWSISPGSYGITGVRDGKKISFVINRTGYVVLFFSQDQDFTKRLVIFVELPEQLPEGNLIDITQEYCVDNTGFRNETSHIQKALDDISGTENILYFPPGIYKSFGLRIQSNSRIHLAKGARILADTVSMESYLNNDKTGTNRFIYIKDAENIQITGNGGFDGNGTWFRGVFHPNGSDGKGAMRVLFIVNSRDISFDGILLKDAARWNTQMVGCENITFVRCKMMNNPNKNKNLTNFDGWDPDASRHIRIIDCFGWAGDDNIAIKCVGTGSPKIIEDVDDIEVKGCVFLTKKSSLKIGTETRCSKITQIVFEDNDVVESDRAMAIDVQDQAIVDGVLYKNNRVEYNFPDSQKRGIFINLKKRNDTQFSLGKILNVQIESCSFKKIFPNKFKIVRDASLSVASDVQVTFKDLKVGGNTITSLSSTYFDSSCNGMVSFE
ncbi:glycosyl hydrolase family 28 protein [Coprobacter sp.]